MSNRGLPTILTCVLAAYLTQMLCAYYGFLETPALLVAVSIFFGLHAGGRKGAIAGFLCGLLLEAHGIGGWGAQLAVLTASGALSGWAARQFFRDGIFSTFLLPLAWNWIYLAAADLSWARPRGAGWGVPGSAILSPAVLAGTLLATAASFLVLRRVFLRRTSRPLRWS